MICPLLQWSEEQVPKSVETGECSLYIQFLFFSGTHILFLCNWENLVISSCLNTDSEYCGLSSLLVHSPTSVYDDKLSITVTYQFLVGTAWLAAKP
jgi:hypothetical protein